jgi:hypothetical protein
MSGTILKAVLTLFYLIFFETWFQVLAGLELAIQPRLASNL